MKIKIHSDLNKILRCIIRISIYRRFIVVFSFILLLIGLSRQSHAATSWFKPIFALKEEYDDNIFLTDSDESEDFLTTLAAGISFEPQLNKHELTSNYIIDFEMFADNSDQNTTNQTFDIDGGLNFNDWRIEADNLFRRYENLTGSEDTARIPRTSDRADVKLIYSFNKLDVGLNYTYSFEDYRNDNSIGSFAGQALTYQDLDSDENSGELELAFQFWPKTFLLFSNRYGTHKYDTNKKSDSEYYDILTGLRGRFFTRGEIEGKIGYRAQDYDDPGEDFDGVIYNVSLVEKFSEKDTLTIDFERTIHSTTYQQNAYFKITNISGVYTHDFNNRVTGKFKGAYWFNKYPTETIEGSKTAKREDDLWHIGTGLSYKLPKYVTIDLNYTYANKSSNFENFDYKNNRISTMIRMKF
ncbi:MAG: outer membrane beta-barrel protein [Candidatus Omnitrophica bacterium]|nr:outer membrane beta-barrel protein [Candidatus Omnitrophota bacterium]